MNQNVIVCGEIIPNPESSSPVIISFRNPSSGHIYSGNYYVLYEDDKNMLHISENRTLENMYLAQNWVISRTDILGGLTKESKFPYIYIPSK